MSGLRDCMDLDFGFTPSTNLLQLRRLALDNGHGADAPAAWLNVSTGTLDVLAQRYERQSETTYWYEAPRFNYAEILRGWWPRFSPQLIPPFGRRRRD